jgi:hypothetical protein
MSVTTLRNIIRNIEEISDELSIYATRNSESKWIIDAPAELVLSEDAADVGKEMEELSYFLEVDIAKEVIQVWKEWRNGHEPDENQRIEALLYYVNNDAYIN